MAKQVQVTWDSEGKTYTLFGKSGLKRPKLDLAQDDSDLGLVFRLINHVFSELETRNSGKNRPKGCISFSMFQIYNEKVYDLLQVGAKLNTEARNSIRGQRRRGRLVLCPWIGLIPGPCG